MKIKGRTLGVNRGSLELHRPDGVFTFVVHAVPYGFPDQIALDIPDPEPPTDLVKDSRGAVLRDENGFALKTQRTNDARYRRELRRARALRLVLRVREALRGDPQIVFEADEAKPKFTGRAYAEAVEAEFKGAGFSDQEIVLLLNKSLALESGAAQRIDEASKSFLPQAAESAEPDGSSQSSTASP